MEGDGTGRFGVHEGYGGGKIVLWGADASGADVLGGGGFSKEVGGRQSEGAD